MSKDGLCAIVTGSASGLGAATAAILAKGGARIVINYSNSKAEAEATADLCRSAGAEVVVVQGDVSRDEDCKKIAAAAAAWGRLDVLVNNAGTTKHVPHHDMDGLSADDFQRIYAVNTIGPFQMIRAARPLLEAAAKASGHASSVVNVSSVAGIGGGGCNLLAVLVARDVALHHHDFGARLAAEVGGRFGLSLAVGIIDDDACAALRQNGGGGGPEARGRTGDYRAQTILRHPHFPLYVFG